VLNYSIPGSGREWITAECTIAAEATVQGQSSSTIQFYTRRNALALLSASMDRGGNLRNQKYWWGHWNDSSKVDSIKKSGELIGMESTDSSRIN